MNLPGMNKGRKDILQPNSILKKRPCINFQIDLLEVIFKDEGPDIIMDLRDLSLEMLPNII